jgi:hypothetical protein
MGSGNSAVIINSIPHAITIRSENITVTNLKIDNPSGIGVNIKNQNTTVQNITVLNCSKDSFRLDENSKNGRVINCISKNPEAAHIRGSNRQTYTGNILLNGGVSGMRDVISNSIITNNIISGPALHGLDIAGDNNAIGGNRIINSGIGIRARGTDNIYYNNRISDCTTNLSAIGTGEILDDNLTGPSN